MQFTLMIALPMMLAADRTKREVPSSELNSLSHIMETVEAMVTSMKVRMPAECRLLARSHPMIAAQIKESAMRSTMEPRERVLDHSPKKVAIGSTSKGFMKRVLLN